MTGGILQEVYELSEKSGIRGARVTLDDSILSHLNNLSDNLTNRFEVRKNKLGKECTHFQWPILFLGGKTSEECLIYLKSVMTIAEYYFSEKEVGAGAHYLSTLQLLLRSLEKTKHLKLAHEFRGSRTTNKINQNAKDEFILWYTRNLLNLQGLHLTF